MKTLWWSTLSAAFVKSPLAPYNVRQKLAAKESWYGRVPSLLLCSQHSWESGRIPQDIMSQVFVLREPNEDDDNNKISCSQKEFVKTNILDEQERRVIMETWNWCAHFVVPFQLCPWAASSVQEGSLFFYLVRTKDEQFFQMALDRASREFQKRLPLLDPNQAIAFVIQCSNNNNEWVWDFDSFYDWYLEAEEEMLDQELEGDILLLSDCITWAPFHPHWQYQDGETILQWEKRTPHPTVSIVSTTAIEKAGSLATQSIVNQNAKILQAKTLEEWQSIYDSAVFQQEQP